MLRLAAAAAALAGAADAATGADVFAATVGFTAEGVAGIDAHPVFVWYRDTACRDCNRTLLTWLRAAEPWETVALQTATPIELSVSRCNLSATACEVWRNHTTHFGASLS